MSHTRTLISASITLLLLAMLTACGSLSDGVHLPGTSTDAAPAIGPESLDDTEWLLSSLNRSSLVEGSEITLEFPAANYLQGQAGCNYYGADYVLDGDQFHIPKLHKTDMDCDAPTSIRQQEKAFFEALTEVGAYGGTTERLEFETARGETILTFARQIPPSVDSALQDTEWVLTVLEGQSPLEGSRITLNLGQEGLDGYEGCNQYGGEYEAADGGTLITSEIWQTAQECATPALQAQERAYVEALRNVLAYRLMDDRLELEDAAGETTLVFTRTEDLAMNPGDLLGTAWRFSSVDGESPIEGSTITLAFHNEYRAGGYAGCNGYVATYQANGDDLGFLFFAMLGTTCLKQEALMKQQDEFTSLLSNTTGFRLAENQLELLTQEGQVLTFDRLPDEANASLEGTQWTLSAVIEEKDVEGMGAPLPMLTGPPQGIQITATFENGRVNGSGGCNSYSADYVLDGTAFTLQTISATEMGCLEPLGVLEQEQQYLSLLGEVTTYRLHGNQLWLEMDDGRALVFSTQVPGW